MKLRIPEPTNCTPMQMSRKPVRRATTLMPSLPRLRETQRAERRTSQIIRQVAAIPATVAE